MVLAMGARTRRFTSLATGSNTTKAAGIAALCAVMLLAGCGGSSGSASDASTPVIRGDAAAAGVSEPTVIAPGNPPKPTVVVGDGKVTVSVAAAATGGAPTSYDVEVYTVEPKFKSLGKCTVTGASGSCDVTGLPSGYTWVRAQARNAAGLSAPVDAAKVRVVEAGGAPWYEVVFYTRFGSATGSMDPQQASTPTPLRANTWNPPGKEFIGWAITKYATTSGNDNVVYADKAIYSFDSDVYLEAVWRDKATVSVPGSVPGTPPAPTVVAGTAKVTATVAAGTSGGTPATYTVTAYTVNGTAAGTCTVTGASGSCDVTDLTAGSTYTVTATAKNTAGDSGASVASSPVTLATVPGAPALTALSRRSKTEVWVTFSAPSSTGGTPITGYTVTATLNGKDVTQSFPAEAGRVSVGPLTRYAVYTFTVRAVNSVGTSGPSKASSFRVG